MEKTVNKPPRTEIVLTDSVCCSQGAEENSTLLFAVRWPQEKSATEAWLNRLKWTSNRSLYLGFDQLIDLGNEASFRVADLQSWQRVWNAPYDPKQFHKLTFPEKAPGEFSQMNPLTFHSGSLAVLDLRTASGGVPGCAVERLTTPDLVSQKRAELRRAKPVIPQAIQDPGQPVSTRKVDLKKEDLGAVINRNDWPSGTVLEATGFGFVQMTPARIDGKALRIEFRQGEGAPLKLQPKTGTGASPESDGLFHVTRGTLDVTNGNFESPQTAKQSLPPWLIAASDSNVILRGCRLQGSDAEGSNQLGLIQWTTTTTPDGSSLPNVMVCLNSYLVGAGTGINAKVASGSIYMMNSIVAVKGDGVELVPVAMGTKLLSNLVAEHVTFSTTSAAIRMHSAVGNNESLTTPVHVFVEQSAILSLPGSRSGESAEPTFIRLDGPVIDLKQLEWFGSSNGVSKQIIHLLYQDEKSAAKTGLEVWKETFGNPADERLLTGDDGVYLQSTLPTKFRELKPSSFTLHNVCRGSTWSEGGGPIGAGIDELEKMSTPRKGTTSPTTPSGTTRKTPANPIPPKKNVGF